MYYPYLQKYGKPYYTNMPTISKYILLLLIVILHIKTL